MKKLLQRLIKKRILQWLMDRKILEIKSYKSFTHFAVFVEIIFCGETLQKIQFTEEEIVNYKT